MDVIERDSQRANINSNHHVRSGDHYVEHDHVDYMNMDNDGTDAGNMKYGHHYQEDESGHAKDTAQADETPTGSHPHPHLHFPNFVVGISGGPSSGKTTVAVLLDMVLEMAFRQLPPDPNLHLPPQNIVIHQDDYYVNQKQQQEEDWDRIKNCNFEQLVQDVVAGPDPANATTTPAEVSIYGYEYLSNGSLSKAIAALSQPFKSNYTYGTLTNAAIAMRESLTTLLLADKPRLALAGNHVCIDTDGYAQRIARRFTIVEGETLLARSAPRDPMGWVRPDSVEHALRAARRVQERMDVVLFLPTTKDEARQRRVGSAAGERAETRKHFDEVTWPNYERYHQHIVDVATYGSERVVRKPRPKDEWSRMVPDEWEYDSSAGSVHVRPADAAASLDETLVWAAHIVSSALAERLLHDATYKAGKKEARAKPWTPVCESCET
ncbi:hypothetical protein GGR53DRAFT_531372 [Hypoxylon sp. FL1150]|nr:hypothetical protein GGR53DRAFT_531372 [Hypoxylon sp. FL1150]